jgi:protocatechuate 3,4-dioxygenase beta subunit
MLKLSILWRISMALAILSLAACSTASPVSSVTSTIVPTLSSLPTPGQPAASPNATVITATATITAAPTATAVPSAAPTATPQSTTAAAACAPPTVLTPALTEGPYFKAGSPEKTSLAGGLPGMKLALSGYVLDINCKPVAGALLDFWQADSQGNYDNAGYTLRGHQYSRADGSYRLETVVPGLYPGRTEHIHFKVQAKGGPLLTSQLFFPGVTQNQEDGIYDARLLINVVSTSQTNMLATYTFIVATK